VELAFLGAVGEDPLMKKWLFIFCGLSFATAQSTAGAELAASMGRLDQALLLLNESSLETCSICAEQKKRRAFGLLDEVLVPGTILAGDQGCVFNRAPGQGQNEMLLGCDALPDKGLRTPVILRFHTPAQRLIGVLIEDYTEETLAAEFNSAPPGSRFKGSVVLIDYPYGDGSTYHYHVKTNQLHIHCRILSLHPAK
jgi:hypothetical protein